MFDTNKETSVKKSAKKAWLYVSDNAHYIFLGGVLFVLVFVIAFKTNTLQALQDILNLSDQNSQEPIQVVPLNSDAIVIDAIQDDYTDEYSDAPEITTINALGDLNFLEQNFSPEELAQLAEQDDHVESEGVIVADPVTPVPFNKTEFEKWAYDNGPVMNFKRKDGTIIQIHACEKENMVTKTMFGTSVTMHKEMLPYLDPVITAWQQAGGNSFYKIPGKSGEYVGSYSCRMVRGSTTRLSNHSYGLAIDINPSTNPYVIFVDSLSTVSGVQLLVSGIPTKYSPPTLYVDNADYTEFISDRDNYTDMPQDFVTLWKSNGWGWGGNFGSKKDAMHFSLSVNEGGVAGRFDSGTSYGSSTGGIIIIIPPTTTTGTNTSTSGSSTGTASTNTDNNGGGNGSQGGGGANNPNSNSPHNSDEDDGAPGASGSHGPEDKGNGNNKSQEEDEEDTIPTSSTPLISNPPGNGSKGGNSQNKGKDR